LSTHGGVTEIQRA